MRPIGKRLARAPGRKATRRRRTLPLSDATKDSLISHVSHALRTPLAAARLYLGVVTDDLCGPVSAEQKETLSKVDRNLAQLEAMVANLLEATRLDSGQLQVRAVDMDLAPVAARALEVAARGRDLRFVDQVPSVRVHADPELVRQVLGHLLDNAAKFTPAGGTITLRAHAGPEVRVDVTDTGHGIAPAQQERIFEKFTGTEELDDSSRKGLGLGLHLARNLVERQGGRLRLASSSLGVGSTFSFTLPAAKEGP